MQFIEGHRVHLDAEVDAVQQRAGHPAAVLPHRAGRTGAGPGRVAVVAAFAGVHGGDELEACRIGDVGVGARHRHAAALQRLAQGFPQEEYQVIDMTVRMRNSHGEYRWIEFRAKAMGHETIWKQHNGCL